MRGHTREHRTNKICYNDEIDRPISAREFFQNTFGDRPEWAVHLRGFRIREGLTQLELAQRLGIRQSQISEMERGKRSIGKAFAKKLADFFHTDYKSFL
jgi:DNA-binding XRE family transcriptional regulator